MIDRFDAQLRQHLLGTADERPAEGQLASIVEHLAVTKQRPSLPARLTWWPGRIGPFPTAALRYGLIAAALVALLAGTLIVAFGPQARSTVFEGTWTAIDPADGSTMHLYVGRGATPTVRFEDLFATGDACVADEVKHFTADGSGEIAGTRLEAAFPDGGGCGLGTVSLTGIYEYHAGTDTLVDQADVRWTRPGAVLGPTSLPPASPTAPTEASASEPPATDVPATDVPATEPTPADPTTSPSSPSSSDPVTGSECADVSDGTYEVTVGELLVTAEVPAGWYGLREDFDLGRGTCGARAEARIQMSVVSVVYPHACDWRDTGVVVSTPDEAAAALAAQTGHETSVPQETSFAGYPGRRFDFSVPVGVDATPCDDGIIALWGSPEGDGSATPQMGPGQTVPMFLLDVDGQAIAVAATHPTGASTPDANSQVIAILGSLHIEP